ncbi:MAG: hypothetical protein BGP06_21005 [Rhizobiales bacterium 65-9]|nr:siderophore-interacting protein [Hyphomicrobiales bacterium]OJY36502.1 MAG: hypothetical protein BGP06_21005 [Rhizobiales bacterium 65-9]
MAFLEAQTRISTLSARAYMATICDNLSAMEMLTRVDDHGARISLADERSFADLTATNDGLDVNARSATEQGLSALKFMLGLQLEKVAASEKPEVVWSGHGCDLDVLPGLREMRVRRFADITPHVRRITLSGDNLARFDSDSIHVRLLFPPAGLEKPEWPRPGKNGRPSWPADDRRPAARLYTIRRVNVADGEMDIDFVLHEAPGVASDWAKSVKEGDLIGLLGPGGRELATAQWHLIGGDETAIPAIARILERLPADARGATFIEVEDERETQSIPHPEGVSLTWLFRRGQKPGRNTLLADALKSVSLPDHRDVFAWLGAEDAIAQTMRSYWRNELGLNRAQHLAVGYWRLEKESV